LRRALRDDLGVDPSPQTRAAHAAILGADRSPIALDAEANARLGHDRPDRAAQPGRPDRPDRPGLHATPSEIPPDDQALSGRVAELAEILEPPESVPSPATRIVTVVGIGGVGKTSLAVRAAHLLRERFPDGQLYLNLRGFDPRHEPLTPAAALVQLLSAIGVAATPRDPERRVALWRTAVAGRRLLVLLDNAASADQVEDLLPGAPGSMVIVTSRNRLSGLTVRHGAQRVTLGPLDEAESHELLAAAMGGAVVTADQAAISRLIRLCDGLPFAVRLAAEQLGRGAYLDVADLVGAMTQARSRLDVLDLEHDGIGSVRELLACSEHALGDDAQRLLRLIGPLPISGMTVHAVAALLDVSPPRARVLLAELHAQHLLHLSGETYVMHDLTRAYAAEHTPGITDRERSAALGRLLDWYISMLADGLGMAVIMGHPTTRHERTAIDDKDAFARWALAELPDLVALLSHAQADGHHERAWQLAASLFPTFFTAGNAGEWLDVLELAMRSARILADPYAQAVLLNHGSVACHRLGRTHDALQRLARAMDLLDPEHPYRVNVLGNYCSALRAAGRLEEALPLARDALSLVARVNRHSYARANVHNVTSELFADLGRWPEAAEHAIAGLEQARRGEHRVPETKLLIVLGRAANGLGDRSAAQRHLDDALTICAASGDRYDEGCALLALAQVRAGSPDPRSTADARQYTERAYASLSQVGAEEAEQARALLARLGGVDAARGA
ncbi:MAG: ATP-binding protein, partial [Dermatophilaceae bacterium]